MMIEHKRYSSGRVAIANLAASIAGLEQRVAETVDFASLSGLSKLLFLRGDLLGRIADHDQAELVACEAIAIAPDAANALFLRARLAGRFHRFAEASVLLEQALAAGHPKQEVEPEQADLLQATGHYGEAYVLRDAMAQDRAGIHTFGALATLLAEIDHWAAAEDFYQSALKVDENTSPIPCGQLLFEWGVSAMRRGNLDRAEAILAELEVILPAHVPGRGHRAEAALARGELDLAEALIVPLLDVSDDPEYRATYAEICAARGDRKAVSEAARAAADYERLLERRPEAYADHAAAFFTGVGDRPERAVELALANWKLRDTPRSRKLLARAQQKARAHLTIAESAA